MFSASLWGLSWWPLKGFAGAGLGGPLLSMLTYGAVGLLSSWWLLREYRAWRSQAGLLLALACAGGWANFAFVNALMTGEVARVMFLFYLAPVWSVLGGRVFLGERVRPRRAAAVVLALVGLCLVLGTHATLVRGLSSADLLALSAGLAFSANNLVARAGQSIPMPCKTVAVFLGAGVLATLATVSQRAPVPSISPALAAGLVAYGAVWLVLATASWQYGVTHLESGRAGIVLLGELLVGVLSAQWLGEQSLGPAEWLGGVLIAAGALLEATDVPDSLSAPEPA
jgi:drug/metabolite transporter (DMT)-like permease